MNKTKYILVIVDCQNDFCKPDGALYVNGAEDAIFNIKKLIGKEFDKIHSVIYTQDYHPENHVSFKTDDNVNGLWPKHCVVGTPGCDVDASLLKVTDGFELQTSWYCKGYDSNVEEYSAFLNQDITLSSTSIKDATEQNIPVVVCGVAGDYCVIETALTLRDMYNLDVLIYTKGIASIDDEYFKKLLQDEKFTIYN